MSHTPGPWTVDPKYPLRVCPMVDSTDDRRPGKVRLEATITDLAGGGYVVPAYGNSADFVAYAKAHYGDSAIMHPTITYEHAKANALLIAAAPSMYSYIKRKAFCGDEEAKTLLLKARGQAE